MEKINYVEKYSLVGIDGNAYSILGYVDECMVKEDYTINERGEYRRKATSSDYNNLVRVSVEQTKECNKRYNERTKYDKVATKEDLEIANARVDELQRLLSYARVEQSIAKKRHDRAQMFGKKGGE